MHGLPTVSVVTPTHGRERFLPGLLRSFRSQTLPALELVVADDSSTPSPTLVGADDPRVRYLHLPSRLTVGDKRNLLIEAARGEVVAFFDDDDLYAPDYLATMVAALGDADLVKLAGWFALDVTSGGLYYWDTSQSDLVHHRVGGGSPVGLALGEQFPPDFVARNVDGYGFSYVFRRSALERARFPGRNFGEDLDWVTALRRAGGRVVHVQDAGTCVHLVHAASTSVVFPQYRVPPGAAARLFPALAAHLAAARGL